MNKQRGYNAKRTKVSMQNIEALSESPFPQTQVTLQKVWSVGYKAGWASVLPVSLIPNSIRWNSHTKTLLM